jgi:Zn-dependent peptidase ImmA (M78 family)
MRERKWLPEHDEEFRRLHAEGKTREELASHFGVSVNSINGRKFRLGLTKPNARRGKHMAGPERDTFE